MRWILDASIAVRWFLSDERHSHADSVLERLVHEPGTFAVPELFAFETFSVLQRLHPKPLEVFANGVIPILQGGLLRYPMTSSLARKANRFTRNGLTGHDACYVGLAEELDGMWLTFDSKAVKTIRRPKLAFCISEELPRNWDD